jgi:hypothetical protein
MEEVENEQVWSDSKISCEEWSEGDVKGGAGDIVKTIPVTPRMGKMIAKTMQVTKVRQVTMV